MIISGAPPVARWHVLASHVWLHGCAPARSAPCCASTPRSSLAMGVVAPQVDRPEVAVGGGENPRVTALSPLRDRLYRRMGLRLARPALRRREPPVDIDGRGMAVWQPSVNAGLRPPPSAADGVDRRLPDSRWHLIAIGRSVMTNSVCACRTRRRRAAPSAIGCTGADRDGEGFPSKP